ncbi:MAG: response regulator [Bacteroidia bacterium]
MNEQKIFMIVDDDSDDREFFCEAVKEIDSSAECLIAVDGEDALKQLRSGIKQLPDFIFLDLNMPRMDGKTCLAELKKDEQLKNIPVIIFSTSSHQHDIDETHELGAAYFLPKPSDPRKLKNEIVFVMQQNWALHGNVTSV